jgi:hypothetical protein
MSEIFSPAPGSVGPERREYLRIVVDLPASANFLSVDPDFSTDEVVEGRVTELSASGVLLIGKFPEGDWIEKILDQSLFLNLTLDLKDDEPPMEALTRAQHAVKCDDGSHAVGLHFRGMGRSNKDRIFKRVISEHID